MRKKKQRPMRININIITRSMVFALGSSLGPILANLFTRWLANNRFRPIIRPVQYLENIGPATEQSDWLILVIGPLN